MEKVRAHVMRREYFSMHNYLGNCAYHFKKRFDEIRRSKSTESGIGLEIIAAITMVAFTNEARINILGKLKIRDYEERQEFKLKISSLFAHLGLHFDGSKKPHQDIIEAHDLRDAFAHGKCMERGTENVKSRILTQEKLLNINHTENWITKALTYECFDDLYQSSQSVWLEILTSSNINEYDLSNQGEYFIEIDGIFQQIK